ncbi:MAG TPA: phosphoglycerate kinase [Candidatus Portnoybacteria bacterium]|nr:phosphoglycerate kinase [Candidatus Portnoybacteria bacterium]
MEFLKNINVAQKRVLVRVDFNVDVDEKSGQVVDDFKIRRTLPTLKYLLQNNARIILMSHLGEPKNKEENLSLKWVAKKTAELLGKEIIFIDDCAGEEAKQAASKLKDGQIILLENLRFYKEEKANDEIFAKNLAALGEIYVNDAFGVSHRSHASVSAITRFLPSYAGLLMEEEIINLTKARDAKDSSLCVIIGGAKISTKIKLIKSFLDKAQDIILGGALANTVLHARGIEVGKSLIEAKMIDEVKGLVANAKIHLPTDAVFCTNNDGTGVCRTGLIEKTGENESIFDIGPESEKLFCGIIQRAQIILWNGPMGFFENEAFGHGTRAIAEAIAGSGAFSITGGGETVSYLDKLKLTDKFSFVSTGGGAMLEFLAGEPMPGIEALEQKL